MDDERIESLLREALAKEPPQEADAAIAAAIEGAAAANKAKRAGRTARRAAAMLLAASLAFAAVLRFYAIAPSGAANRRATAASGAPAPDSAVAEAQTTAGSDGDVADIMLEITSMADYCLML